MPQVLIFRVTRGKHLTRIATRRNLNADNRRQDVAMLAKLDALRAALAGDVARFAHRDPELAEHFRGLVRQVEAMQLLEVEDRGRHGVERAIVDAEATAYVLEVAA